ncbi:MAG TPA: MerR family transcriptional regulator [Terriglobales bacterium]|nr:MerR family transcriptional regulator [Terriglobales bacterium]
MMATIHSLTDSIGVTAETVRHYREMGLLHPAVRDNGYYDYSVDDALTVLLARELRSYDLPLSQTRDFFKHATLHQYLGMLDARQEKLERRLDLLQLEIKRMQETRVYASCGVRILNGVEEFDGPATWAVGALSRAGGLRAGRGKLLSRWTAHLPFTYVSATIPLAELSARKEGPYALEVGAGALCHYVDEFKLPLPDDAHFQPGGHFVRTCIATRDILSIGPADLAHLHRYVEERGYVYASCTGCRLLFIENAGRRPLYYVLIWVRVEPK